MSSLIKECLSSLWLFLQQPEHYCNFRNPPFPPKTPYLTYFRRVTDKMGENLDLGGGVSPKTTLFFLCNVEVENVDEYPVFWLQNIPLVFLNTYLTPQNQYFDLSDDVQKKKSEGGGSPPHPDDLVRCADGGILFRCVAKQQVGPITGSGQV